MFKEENKIIIDKILTITSSPDLQVYVNIVYQIYEINISTRIRHQDNIRKLKLENNDFLVCADRFVNKISECCLHCIKR